MNKIDISTEGICVYISSKIDSRKSLKIFIRVAFLALITRIILLSFSKENSTAYYFGLFLFPSGILMILPMLRTLLWNLYGEEYISFSTKSIAQQLSFGFFKPALKTYEHNSRIKFQFEVIREEEGVKVGFIHFYSFDKNNQPFHLFQTSAYISESDCRDIISKLQLIFSLDKNLNVEYSAN